MFPEVDAPGEIALMALVGSHAYGTSHPESDTDFRGCYIVPTGMLFHLDQPMATYDRQEPDVTLHELEKFARLCAAANPTVLETLWAERYIATEAGEILRANRQVFLSRRVFRTYVGYATQQLKKAARGVGGSRGTRHLKRDKFYLHTYRLMEAGIHCLETGDLRIRVEDPEALWARARQPIERIQSDFFSMENRILLAREGSPLPEHPDYERINAMLVRLRLHHL